jgi:protein involved in polysaccharide export with SLBB domain
MRQFFVVAVSVFLFIGSFLPAFAQVPEDKKTDTDVANPFLNSSTSEQLDLLQRYYQRIFSQQGQPGSSRLGSESLNNPARYFSQAQAISLEGPIDQAQYVVGPFDVLELNIWGLTPFRYAGPITPEGTLIIPTVGEIALAGITLAEAKEQVRQAVRKKYTAGEISVSLVSLRTFKVRVAGTVANPGAYVATPVDRVDRVLALANFATEELAPVPKDKSVAPTSSGLRALEKKPAPVISMRNIKIYRANRDTLGVDLVRYYASGEARFNPCLRDGDLIFVPAVSLAGNQVSIWGGVRVPGIYEFRQGDSLRTILQIAQGPTALADLENVEVARFLPDGRQAEILAVNLRSGQNGHAPDLALQPNDRVFIREHLHLRQERMVSVNGAVVRPGKYALLNDHATLSEIIARAGGFVPQASLAEARLIRQYDHPDQMLNNRDYARLMDLRLIDLTPQDREYFNYEMAIQRGAVTVDFVKLFNHHEKSADVQLLDGDEIYVPLLRQIVNVFGQVNSPGHVGYVDGMDHRYYLEKAGGFSKEADRGKVRILKRDTKAWMKPGDAKLEPGDEIFVSRKVRRPSSVFFNTFRDIVQTTASLATVVLLYRQVSK